MRFDSENTETRSDPEDTKGFEMRSDPEDAEDRELRIDTENIEDPEDTQERPVISLQFYQSFQEDTQEKTVRLEKPALSGKEA